MKNLDAFIMNAPNPLATIIWLHGLGASGHDFVDALPLLSIKTDQLRFVFPHAPSRPVTINYGMTMPAWYDLLHLNFEGPEDEVGLKEANDRIQHLIAQERLLYGNEHHIFLIGFSQGGALALYAALHSSYKLAGCAVLSGYVAGRFSFTKEASEINKHLPIFMAHGVDDTVVPFSAEQLSAAFLEERGWSIKRYNYPMGHQISVQEMKDLGHWIMQCIKTR